MKLKFENFGGIQDGEIRPAPLTIFCGPNHGGKSHVMVALYALHHQIRTGTINATLPEINQFALKLMSDSICKLDVIDFHQKHMQDICRDVSRHLRDKLDGVFNADAGCFSTTTIEFTADEENDLFRRDMTAAMIDDEFELSPSGGKNASLSVNKSAHSNALIFSLSGEFGERHLKEISALVYYILMRLFFKTEASGVFALPAERAAINLLQAELSVRRQGLFEPAAIAARRKAALPLSKLVAAYPQPVADYIEFLNNLDALQERQSDYAALAKILEQELLGGAYLLRADGTIGFLLDGASNPVALHLTSAIVKNYFGLWFYLRHVASKGDMLMIDEPELNLHPGSQCKLAKIISRMVNAGICVAVSTHSDFMIREWNNLIMLSDDFDGKPGLLRKYGYSQQELLCPLHVAAYQFGDGGIAPLEIDPYEGIIAQTFDAVIAAQNRSSNEIFYAKNGVSATQMAELAN